MAPRPKLLINKAFMQESAFKTWFSTLLQYSLIETVTGGYHDFGQIGRAALQMTAKSFDQTKQMEYAGLIKYFHEVISIDSLHKYKPHPDTYRMVTRQMGLADAEVMLIAAHGWDIKGAKDAGLQAGFLARPGQFLYPLSAGSDLNENSLLKMAEKLIRL